MASAAQAEATIFLILRRMRAPLIVLITIFAVSVLGLTLVPGRDAAGGTTRMSFFDAFYFMSYTASTIGFGELPDPFTTGPAALGHRGDLPHRHRLGLRHRLTAGPAAGPRRSARRSRCSASPARSRGCASRSCSSSATAATGELLSHSFDALGRRVVVIDNSDDRIDALELGSYHGDIPGLVADARDPGHLGVAGLGNPRCEAVLALTNDDEANLAVAMTAALLRPELQVIARTVSPAIAERMRAFGGPTVINPFDRFGDHLRLAMRAPGVLPADDLAGERTGRRAAHRGRPAARGAGWSADTAGSAARSPPTSAPRASTVTVVEPPAGADPHPPRASRPFSGTAPKRTSCDAPASRTRSGFVAGTDNDTSNISMVAAARRPEPSILRRGQAEPGRQHAPVRRHGRSTPCSCRPRWWRTRCSPS